MKHLFTALLALAFFIPAHVSVAGWQFAKVFPDTALKAPTGVHGIAVDPDGNPVLVDQHGCDAAPAGAAPSRGARMSPTPKSGLL